MRMGRNLFLLMLIVMGLTVGRLDAWQENEVLKALIVDGQNNHGNWPTTTQMMKSYLLESGKFQVDITTTKPKGVDPDYRPEFKNYDVVISNYNGSPWPEETKAAFVDYVKSGGGLVVVHAANNSFPRWREYNEMIGLGGWGGRNEKSGPYVYYNKDGKTVRDASKGRGGNHGPQHEFTLVKRDPDHPIMKDIPSEWLHMKDELYDKLRGPAMNMKILATSFAAKKMGGTGRHEPMVMTLTYGDGRIFHTPMGHGNYSQECVGFITLFQRGAQWAATGKVTIPVPDDFPTATSTSSRKFVPPPAPSAPDKAGLSQDFKAAFQLAESGKIELLLKSITLPEDFQQQIERHADRDERIRQFEQNKMGPLIAALKSINIAEVKIEDGWAVVPFGEREMFLQHLDGHWRIHNSSEKAREIRKREAKDKSDDRP